MDRCSHLRAFRKRLTEEGFGQRTPAIIIGQLGIFIAATAVGIHLLLVTDNWLIEGAAMLLITLAGMGVSTNAHTASHNAVSKRDWVNKALVYFGYPFFLQVSASYWRNKHIVIHHPNPNVTGVDDDADLTPYFALNQEQLSEASPLHHWRYRWQWIYLPFLLSVNAFGVVLKGWIFLVEQLISPRKRKRQHWIDLVMMILHYVFWVGCPLLVVPAMDVATFTLLRFTMMSYGMFALFAPAHYPAEAILVKPESIRNDIVLLHTLTTINYRTGWLGRLVCGGVEYQIEHHLFPNISPTHYPKLSQKVEKFCERYSYPYRSLGWGEAIWKSLVTFYHPKPVAHTLDEASMILDAMDAERLDVDQRVPEKAT